MTFLKSLEDIMLAHKETCRTDEYNRGLFNGLALAKSILTGQDPDYIESEGADNWAEETSTITDYDLPETEVYPDKDENGNTIITASKVAACTQMICPTCGAHNYLKNGKCIKCDYHHV